MGKRGSKPKERKPFVWSREVAYAIGLLASDGSLSKDGRHMDFTSKDKEQVENLIVCLGLTNTIGKKRSSAGNESYRVQFGDVTFYNFLISIGLTPAKSRTIGAICIPRVYFFDFLRGSFDGDGTFYSYWDKRWRSSHMFYIEFISASLKHIEWLRSEVATQTGFVGHCTHAKNSKVFQLKYAKKEALVIIKKMYYTPHVVCLSRKKVKIQKALGIESKQQATYGFTE